MLVISRREEESIIIDGRIEVVVLGITRDGVRLGIQAPREVQVHRREVFDAIAASNREAQAAQVGSEDPESLKDVAALLRARSPKVRLPKGR